jgi:hypothetical protein
MMGAMSPRDRCRGWTFGNCFSVMPRIQVFAVTTRRVFDDTLCRRNSLGDMTTPRAVIEGNLRELFQWVAAS